MEYPKLTTANIIVQQSFDNFKLAIAASYEARDELLRIVKELLPGKEVVYMANNGQMKKGIVVDVFPEQLEGIKVHISFIRSNGRLSKPFNSVPIDSVLNFLEIR